MAYGVVRQFAGGTEEQYQASIAAVHPSDGSLPEGQVLHVAGPSADGWTIEIQTVEGYRLLPWTRRGKRDEIREMRAPCGLKASKWWSRIFSREGPTMRAS